VGNSKPVATLSEDEEDIALRDADLVAAVVVKASAEGGHEVERARNAADATVDR